MNVKTLEQNILSRWKRSVYKNLSDDCLNILLSLVIKEASPLLDTKESCYKCKSFKNKEVIKKIFK
ncbi:MAG: hypothetical protein M0R17_04980 [Candidatus Omnitrophica bacterium]|jgi:hypothetical protein|nr:hypothetical protein [Candidatus Omnitrophota bacterium]